MQSYTQQKTLQGIWFCFCSIVCALQRKFFKRQLHEKVLSQVTRTISFREKDITKPISGNLFNITLSLRGFPWKKGNIALKGGDHQLLADTLTCCQCPPKVEYYFWIIQNLLNQLKGFLTCSLLFPPTPSEAAGIG